jgi:hypothetical protein
LASPRIDRRQASAVAGILPLKKQVKFPVSSDKMWQRFVRMAMAMDADSSERLWIGYLGLVGKVAERRSGKAKAG